MIGCAVLSLILLLTATATVEGFSPLLRRPSGGGTSGGSTIGRGFARTVPSAFPPSASRPSSSGIPPASLSKSVQYTWSASSLLRATRHGNRRLLPSSALAAASTTTPGTEYDEVCDVLVLGSGPAGRAIASLLSTSSSGNGGGGLNVILADQNLDKPWPPNYGVWKEEWQSVLDRYGAAGIRISGGSVGKAVNREWPVTDCYFGGSFDVPTEARLRLDRPYCQIDKRALQESLSSSSSSLYRTLRANHKSRAIGCNLYAPAGSLVHDETGTTIELETAEKETTVRVRTKLVVDCTGHETELVLRDAREPGTGPPGFQIAYGVLVDVDEEGAAAPDDQKTHVGPYDKDAMTLFDYRTDHYDGSGSAKEKVEAAPTFMYAMPQGGNRIFFEETSLVARPAVSFQECKERCFKRLEYHGIRVTNVYEEEFCYIPMGGALPAKDQRILALGGSAAMVHPSTGYHLCRMLMGAADVADAVKKGLLSPQTTTNNAAAATSSASVVNLDRVAASAYHALWSPENIRQRNFAVFGGEFLMKQNVVGLRGFFDGFFRLPVELWGGFLAGWPGLPLNENHESWWRRMWYGLTFIVRLPLPVALDMAASIASYTLTAGVPLPQSVTPLLGEPESYEYRQNTDRVGDVAAKDEARRMIQESTVTDTVPVAFGPKEETLATSSTSTQETERANVGTGSFQ